MTITYVTGDATKPIADGNGDQIIAHICNDEGKWGAGFVGALSRWHPRPEAAYRSWHRNGTWDAGPAFGTRPFLLGQTQLVLPRAGELGEPNVYVANMLAQRGVRSGPTAPRTVRYGALRACLIQVADVATMFHPTEFELGILTSVHMPRIGCGLGGGDWPDIEPLITETLVDRGVPVTVYDLP